ncbi:hypothetical protein EV645_4347 [Kribbella rubisoli]|uniref:Uncharacterized protein n=1 Tax=Kribbella rubisoli TaxID=3075929 RepID=A0A4Q7WUP8_9ACTN|nr:hypothetical protein [Kribbella rubisoli]RZU13505.1 hypothetical protein EV645_4347 [Kribbella rubisoli]
MPRSVLIAAYVAWPLGAVVVRLLTRVRRRCLAAIGVGWIAALVLATTATPAERVIPIGLIVGSGIAATLCLATARGVTFTFAQDETYWVYDGKIPVGDRLVEVLSVLAGVVGVIGLA